MLHSLFKEGLDRWQPCCVLDDDPIASPLVVRSLCSSFYSHHARRGLRAHPILMGGTSVRHSSLYRAMSLDSAVSFPNVREKLPLARRVARCAGVLTDFSLEEDSLALLGCEVVTCCSPSEVSFLAPLADWRISSVLMTSRSWVRVSGPGRCPYAWVNFGGSGVRVGGCGSCARLGLLFWFFNFFLPWG